MLHINEIELFHEPRKAIEHIFTEIPDEPEMSEDESAFLCGLIKKHRPGKIVEVGIAGGGTSAIILSCFKMLGLKNSKLYSVDYSERFYLNDQYESGYFGKKARVFLDIPEENHVVLTGNVACSFEQIRDNIDFLIIDTMHILPGELLDFITLLPTLNDKAVVVLHDIALPYDLATQNSAIATSVLLACSSGEKYINTFDFGDLYANIAAIEVDARTKEQISNVFSALFVPWEYLPDDKQLRVYRENIKNNYSHLGLELFDAAVTLNKRLIGKKTQVEWLFPFERVSANSDVILFGFGDVGQGFEKQINHTKYCHIEKIVDNDSRKWNEKVHSPSEIAGTVYDHIVVAIANKDIADNIVSQLLNMGVVSDKIIWCNYELNAE